jgi:hypothetical protein
MNKKLSKLVNFLVAANVVIALNWMLLIKAAPLSGQEIFRFELFLFVQVLAGVAFYVLRSKRVQSREEAQVLSTSQVFEASCGD